MRVHKMTARAGGLRALIAVDKVADVVLPSTNSVPVIGTVADKSGTQPEGPHLDVDAPAP